jgi:SHS2 domain-containing protein
MPYTKLDTTDLRISLTAKTTVGLFFESIRAMMELMKDDAHAVKGKPAKRTVSVDAADRTMLLIDFMGEVLKLSKSYQEVYQNVKFKKLLETSLEAELEGVQVESFDHPISVVTYHDADVKKNDLGDWETTVLFEE